MPVSSFRIAVIRFGNPCSCVAIVFGRIQSHVFPVTTRLSFEAGRSTLTLSGFRISPEAGIAALTPVAQRINRPETRWWAATACDVLKRGGDFEERCFLERAGEKFQGNRQFEKQVRGQIFTFDILGRVTQS
jgi:hypothetical protein